MGVFDWGEHPSELGIYVGAHHWGEGGGVVGLYLPLKKRSCSSRSTYSRARCCALVRLAIGVLMRALTEGCLRLGCGV